MPTYPLTTLYCSDEDLAVRASGDWEAIAPRDQAIARGTDGVIDVTSWGLASATVDFEDRGAIRGGMVRLWGARGSAAGSRFGTTESPEWFAVEAAVGGVLTLRRKGLAVGVGEPAGGLAEITGVEFAVLTLAPQIEKASRDLNHRYGIDGRPGRAATDLHDLDDLREACELTVLHKHYLALSRIGGRDDFKAKAKLLKEELDEVLARLSLRWGGNGEDKVPTVRTGTTTR